VFDHDNRDAPRGAEPAPRTDGKRTLVDQLVDLATDTRTGAWPARLYIAAALWLESEREPDGDDRTFLTGVCERVKARATDTVPEFFDGFIRAWLELPETTTDKESA